MSLLIFSGYPQVFHGAMIYSLVCLIPTLFSGHIGSRTNNSLKQYLLTGLMAIAVCIGLTAVQWLPLLELVTWSHRSSGIDILFKMPLFVYLRGFLFTFGGVDLKTLSFGALGSVFVCFVASLSLVAKPNHRIIGHIIASVVLFFMGVEYSTPIFGYLLNHQLVPGLKYFRGVHLYLGISIIGLGLLCGYAIDHIQRRSSKFDNTMKGKISFFACGSFLFFGWAGLVLWLKSDEVAMMTYMSFVAAYFTLVALIFFNRSKWFGYIALFLIVTEIIALRMSPFPFVDPKLFDKPQLVEEIQADIQNKGYKLMDISTAGGVVFEKRWSPNLEKEVRGAFARACPSSNVLWNLPSIGANLALPLARQRLAKSKMDSEIAGADSTQPGMRLIDYLGIRYISADTIPPAVGLEPSIIDGITFLKNKFALPFVQTFTRYEMVNSPDDALTRLKQSHEATLILENPLKKADDANDLPASTAPNDANALEILSEKLANDRYKFEVNAAKPAWLFIADANYIGWQAQIDGNSTPVYSAQVLGKAILVPAGNHKITIEYKPRSFLIGVCFLLLTLFLVLVVGLLRLYGFRLWGFYMSQISKYRWIG